uniref:Uncharacterized protein TCIL3000_9_6230 n=1 Tax=Trypanosoma congolense (strain IL3000) TaxID=1068625 RepID=G0UUZ7_TRYCI|nr:unnamed protein product [Trypanosoma congolense IL3000]
MRRTLLYLMIIPPESHRYSKATFHEGAHRQAPGDSTPWRDAASPLNRAKMWWIAPAAKGTMTAAWCMTAVIGAYCFSIQQDAKGTYLLNNVLLRTLHEEALRADANQERARDLQESVKRKHGEEECDEKFMTTRNQEVKKNYTSDGNVINYELEISRERARSDVVHDRNQQLASELHSVRQELAHVRRDYALAIREIEKLQKLVKL